jgi:molybdopterin-guanine dinucleotide biosynthesis protein MobB
MPGVKNPDAPEKSTASRPKVVGVVGRSGSGKTSILERLVPALCERGLLVGAVKHTSHGFLADRPGKDSYRLYQSGAEAVALISRQQLATFRRRSEDEGPGAPLASALASLPTGLEVVLVEGFSWEPIPRFVLVPEGEQPFDEHLKHGEVLEIVQVPKTAEGRKPDFSQDQIAALTQRITELAD